ncbi:hypothetical protein WM46_15315 [Citrobacter freundii complex sp. CFNIH2]|uniref:thioredoxin family protein n=1 Tax=Citrobacter freundii complex sp. CFNIH2 TaxID=2066049 RepID=UPI000C86B286|nr:thioredoxin family protein [Citrobacter freundii complex sp. CFNIH2]AUO66015.1 hypothetical protein WM46_15315 [Citrobacter freundii complex sp. CFNIH2]
MNGHQLHSAELADLLAQHETVLLDFRADWCQPCQLIAPLIDEVAQQQAGQLHVAWIDIDRQPELAAELGVRSIPTLVLFHRGRETARHSGLFNKLRLRAWLAAGQRSMP